LLREKTLTLLKERSSNIKLLDIAIATGLSFYWLQSFLKNGHDSDPGVDKVETLYNYLSPKKLKC